MNTYKWLATILVAMTLSHDSFADHTPNPLIGRNLYFSYCLVCHGPDGKGTGPIVKNLSITPADLTSDGFQSKSITELVAVIGGYRSRDKSAMPNWDAVLDKTDLVDIAAYVSRIDEGGLTLRGDTRRGRSIFRSACVGCHGNSGNGKGLLAHLINATMMDYTESAEMDKFTDQDLVEIISEGKGRYMPAWKEILTASEIIDVASYVRMLAH